MSTSRNWKRARTDAAGAAEALGDAVAIAGSGLATRAREASDGLAGTLSGGLDDARGSLARAIDPHPVRTRRLPWLVAGAALTALSVWAWRAFLTRPRPADPGTPVSTTAPSEDALFGKPVGNSPTRTDS